MLFEYVAKEHEKRQLHFSQERSKFSNNLSEKKHLKYNTSFLENSSAVPHVYNKQSSLATRVQHRSGRHVLPEVYGTKRSAYVPNPFFFSTVDERRYGRTWWVKQAPARTLYNCQRGFALKRAPRSLIPGTATCTHATLANRRWEARPVLAEPEPYLRKMRRKEDGSTPGRRESGSRESKSSQGMESPDPGISYQKEEMKSPPAPKTPSVPGLGTIRLGTLRPEGPTSCTPNRMAKRQLISDLLEADEVRQNSGDSGGGAALYSLRSIISNRSSGKNFDKEIGKGGAFSSYTPEEKVKPVPHLSVGILA